jgi:antitoxin component of RelBE/YafQ-DinJ toxin-antitoxin module
MTPKVNLQARVPAAVDDELRKVAAETGLTLTRVVHIVLLIGLGVVPLPPGEQSVREILANRRRVGTP